MNRFRENVFLLSYSSMRASIHVYGLPLIFRHRLATIFWRKPPNCGRKSVQAVPGCCCLLPLSRCPTSCCTGHYPYRFECAYNYTSLSDIDVHLVVNFSSTACPALASNFFATKKSLWSKTYDVKVHGHPLELYVEDAREPVTANGVYSILHGEWVKLPKHEIPAPDDSAIERKVDAFSADIETLLNSEPSIIDLNQSMQKLYMLRQNGLLNGGEFSVENLTFKVLRSLGYLD